MFVSLSVLRIEDNSQTLLRGALGGLSTHHAVFVSGYMAQEATAAHKGLYAWCPEQKPQGRSQAGHRACFRSVHTQKLVVSIF